jgi:hypothetical protein
MGLDSFNLLAKIENIIKINPLVRENQVEAACRRKNKNKNKKIKK